MHTKSFATRPKNPAPLRSLWIILFFCLGLSLPATALEPWEAALAKMPLVRDTTVLDRTNCIPLLLDSFREDTTAKALIFMPGATDEFYFFNRGTALLTNRSATILDALRALTNQTLIRVTYRAPFVLVHSPEDALEPGFQIEDEATAARIRKKKFIPHALYHDRDWDSIYTTLAFRLDTRLFPPVNSYESNHFYRHSYAAWNLTPWEALEATAMAGKTTFRIQKKKILFEGDARYRNKPPVPKPQL